ncbi:hypothetical protein BC6307_19420 [Sutcliffiella cohnii]|uniref:Uncharacterized protein n=1 Tax=Sutcliffiella cohnii TaxID=33932 RepID=A0A223KV78_9BACI|nr:hypothetical protein BC6307_19420 [Sutcliffiella cohnii]
MTEFKIQVLQEWKKELMTSSEEYQTAINNAKNNLRTLEIKSLIAERSVYKLNSYPDYKEKHVDPLFDDLQKADAYFNQIRLENQREINRVNALISQIDLELELLGVKN